MASRLLSIAVLAAGLLAAGLLTAPGAFAFTIVAPDGSNSGGSSKFTDPDQKTDRLVDQYQSGRGSSTLQFGNSTLRFSGPQDNYGPSPFIRDRFLSNPAASTVPSQRP